ncbi:MAG TPA: hypothetical protein VN282_24930 [Pyrinomonadaceae bacterium]|nr:hypothetical protein [Pyrinomonadaceae bacterium]
MITSDIPSEGPISKEIRRLWALGDRPIDISRKTGIPLKEVYRRLKRIERLLVKKARVIRP